MTLRSVAPALFLVFAWDASAPSGAAPPQPSTSCLPCHEKQVAEWRESWMARAYTDPAFQHDLEKLRGLERRGRLPAGFTRDCLRCHAPLAYYGGDSDVSSEAKREGVTCTVCHAIANLIEVDERRKTFQIDLKSPTIYGPSEAPKQTPAHPLRHSAVLRSGELCMMCHHDTSRDAPNELTWIEYRDGPYPAQGIRCQDCHMRGGEHRFPGGHAGSALLKGAASVVIEEIDGSRVRVRVANVGAGHHLPTRGAHEPELTLVVEVIDSKGKILETASRSFRYEFIDAEGNPQRLSSPTAVITGARDSTIPPQQSRLETFELAKLSSGARVRARLDYVLVPEYRRAVYPKDVYEQHFVATRVAETEATVSGRMASPPARP